jgi:pyruvate, water dikinase
MDDKKLTLDFSDLRQTHTKIMFNVANPEKVFSLAALPNDGVGLARIEFIIKHMGIHPMALAKLSELKNGKEKYAIERKLAALGELDAKEFFIRNLAEAVGKIAAAFYPKPVIVRTSDFKTNEYARLLGGSEFEPLEENPMLGFRGAARYADERYAAGFALECAALKRVREEMGLTNLKVMTPFCRTVREARKVIAEMAKNGLKQGENDLEIYAMCELPSNVIRAKDFLEIFDGYSIGSNDLTQLVLGIDRDSGAIAAAFDEEDAAVKDMISAAIKAAKKMKKPIGICGQAPSDKPEFAAWLVREGIDSISLNPDSAIKTALVIAESESPNQTQKAKTG